MRVEQRRTVAHSIFRSGPLSDRICGRWDSTVELEVGTIVQVATLTGPVSPAASLCSLSLPLSSLFILLSSFFFIFLSPHLSRTHELTTRVCASRVFALLFFGSGQCRTHSPLLWCRRLCLSPLVVSHCWVPSSLLCCGVSVCSLLLD
jgi:hypothetical protein